MHSPFALLLRHLFFRCHEKVCPYYTLQYSTNVWAFKIVGYNLNALSALDTQRAVKSKLRSASSLMSLTSWTSSTKLLLT